MGYHQLANSQSNINNNFQSSTNVAVVAGYIFDDPLDLIHGIVDKLCILYLSRFIYALISLVHILDFIANPSPQALTRTIIRAFYENTVYDAKPQTYI